MYLKSLEMQGFKSFPDKTKLVFESDVDVQLTIDGTPEGASKGVTVIVGPNGSGKSNIADAMRWVLGEISSKSLRGSKMEDVIFGGADSRRPMGYAEVSVTFDNHGEFRLDREEEEVTVTRRYYRAGESEYFINRKGVRLKDIYELFMNTGVGRDGYSIIGQGRIAAMVSAKSEERRGIFEDASGIAKYRYKKNEAERKLQSTEENMARVNDIFLEVSAQVGPLEKEAEKAKRALELMENKKRADVSLWLYETERLREDLTEAEKNLESASFDLSIAEDSIQSLEVQNNKLFEASQSSKQESEQLLTEIRETTDAVHELDSAYKVAENTLAHAKDLIAATEGSQGASAQKLGVEQRAEREQAEKIAALEAEGARLAETQKAMITEEADLRQKEGELGNAVAQALEDLRALENEAVDLKVRISVLENAKNSDTDKNSSALHELTEYQRVSGELGAQAENKEKILAKYDGEIAQLQEKMEEADSKLEEAEKSHRALLEQCNAETLRADTIAQRIETNRRMEEHFEGYSGAVRYVMKQYEEGNVKDAKGLPGSRIYGPLSKVITVEDKYLTAVEIALGNNLQNIVVEDEATAKAAMHTLKIGQAGRATFFPLTSMKPSSPTKEMEEAKGYAGYIGVADSLLNTNERFKNVLSSLLGRTLVFDNIDHATAMAKDLHYKVRAVTLDGQQINVGGSFTGGSVRTGSGILSRGGEIKRLEGDLKEARARLAEMNREAEDAKANVAAIQEEKYALEDRKELIGVLRNTENGQLEQIRAKLEANETLYQKLKNDMSQFELANLQYQADIDTLMREEAELQKRIQEISDFRTEKNGRRGEVILLCEDLGRKITQGTIRMSENQKDIETANLLLSGIRERIAGIENELLVFEGRINTRHEEIRITEEKMAENRVAYEQANAHLTALNAKRSTVEKDNFEFERKLNELTAKMRDKMNQKELLFREFTKCENRLNSLRESQDKLSTKLWDDYELTRSDAVALGYPPVTKENKSELTALQNECRVKLKNIGHVDLDAVNKYAEVKARYDYMNGQITDLEKAKKELTGIILQLETEMRTVFVDSFNQINENFGKVFSELFGGGSAELSLSDPENVLECGIEIKAAPPGKIIKNLMQLSGGEQAFIGVALFFAILQVNPTPFCILDEIEAALDEVNVERLAQYIKRYSHGTQFIMITHRRGTMAAADRLYGVTMPEHGISKILMLDTNDISKKEGEDWNGIFG